MIPIFAIGTSCSGITKPTLKVIAYASYYASAIGVL